MRQIASRENPHFKALRKLCQSGRERRKTGQVVLDGMHLIEAYAIHYGQPAEIVVSESGALHGEIADYLADDGARCTTIVLADALFADLATVETPSGIMAIVSQPRPAHGLNQEIDALLLDGVQDPGNVGSILRSAAAAGFRQILLSTDSAQAWSPKTLRAAMGAHFQLDIHESADLPGFLGGYQGQGVATTLDATTSLYAANLKGPLAWVFGSEGQGVRPEVAAASRLKVRIPMPGATESLNVAAAAAVCLFETVRQRQ
ncbi:TrmH family RNA methyltransferase [Propionivibrio sp.]|uniref:TrmH family RNA methyltransferase n=1 Tax=Propionivibrio sp. TaxID=2212460 RepID=UPI003BF1D816